jgi:hypothetical protein
MDYGRFFIISLGTSSSKFEADYSAQKSKSWGMLGWLFGNVSTTLVKVHTSYADMVDIYIAAVFKALHSENYLRIQVSKNSNFNLQELLNQRLYLKELAERYKYTMQGTLSLMDIATKENMGKLYQRCAAKETRFTGKLGNWTYGACL